MTNNSFAVINLEGVRLISIPLKIVLDNLGVVCYSSSSGKNFENSMLSINGKLQETGGRKATELKIGGYPR